MDRFLIIGGLHENPANTFATPIYFKEDGKVMITLWCNRKWGGGYYNTSHNVKHGGNETKTKSGYAKTHADVKKHTGGEDTHVRDYLDSKRGRHLVGKEQDKGYIKKDFAKFSKTYKASDYKWS